MFKPARFALFAIIAPLVMFLVSSGSSMAQQPAPAAPPTKDALPAAPVAPGPAATPAPAPAPAPDAPPPPAPDSTTAPTPAAPARTPATAQPPPPTEEELIDTMGVADLQEAMSQLKSNYINAGELSDEALARAILQGTLMRLSTGAYLLPPAASPEAAADPAPFYAEILDDRIGYIRLGSLEPANIEQLDAALENFTGKNLRSIILDLRTTAMSGNFDLAAEAIKRFVPKGKLLFSIRRPGEKQERIFTSNVEPKFQGLTMVAIDSETAGPAEVIAAVLRAQAKSLLVGEPTAGMAVEYADRKLKGGVILRLAVAEVVVPDMAPLFPNGASPDISVALSGEEKKAIMQRSLDKGVSQFIFDKERARMNEAALVAGTYPELDAYQEAQRNGGPEHPSGKDPVLQRAVDLITTIQIYEGKPPGKVE